jgi:YHS domain-containing protein
MRRIIATVSLMLGLIAAAPASSVWAQSQAPASSHAAHEPALGGYCPVAYIAMKTAMKGDPAQRSTYKGQTYLFANADAKKMFDAEPEKYLPAYNGYCATAVAQGMKLASDPKLFAVYKGRTYLFSTAEAKAMFEKDPAGTVAKADANWPRVAKSTN